MKSKNIVFVGNVIDVYNKVLFSILFEKGDVIFISLNDYLFN